MIWVDAPDITVPGKLKTIVGGHPIVAKTLVRRGLIHKDEALGFLDPDFYKPCRAEELPGLCQAVERLMRAIKNGEGVCIWGDFDVDGQTSTTLLYSAIRQLTENVFYHIPVRARESHGISAGVLEKILNPDNITGDDPRWPKGDWQSPGVLLTCDTGISAHGAVADCQLHGVDVLITDHHDLPDTLPSAYAIVNPKLCPEGHPLRELPGVGVAYKLVEELYSKAGLTDELENYLDLVALGIVADLALLVKDTRYLLQKGMCTLRDTRRLGLQILMELAKIETDNLTEEQVAFMLAPRMNALGRLGDANSIVELLTTDDPVRAQTLAYEIEGLNSRRKLITSQVYRGAVSLLEKNPALLEYPVLVLAHSNWPAGVIGIVASRLVERYQRPALLITTSVDNIGRGSARSVEGVDISAAIAVCGDLLESFGGHPMAAGFSIQEENIPVFRERISRAVIESGPIPDSSMQIDLNISFSEITEEFVEEVERLAPFGPGNPPIIMLCEDLRIAHHKLVGRDSEHLSLVVEDRTGHKQQVIWWQGSELVDQLPSEYFDLAFITRNTTFRGKREVQIEWLDYKRRERINDEYEDRKSSIGIVDYRSETDPLERLRKIIDSVGINEIEVWAEGKGLEELKKYGMTAHSRIDIAQSSNLVVFTKPPGGEEIREVIKKVQPSKIYFFSETPGLTDMNEYLSQLSGLVKYSITHYGGELKLRRLAGLTAQKLSSVRLGVEWLAAGGYIQVVFKSDGTSQVVDGGEKSNYESDRLSKKLRDLFEETAAFRDYYEKMDAESLLELINEVE